ncbi:competence protein ComGD [Cytobacillus purgationiresistens]|uniref:Competence protein ComGD n=2 Tax=Cytobacillus purgationiresistens TaxID=863449 RepID=A0ABU0ADV6_9BACI|nr:competence protein ComGD [Cytobacillus purgationiresistens]
MFLLIVSLSVLMIQPKMQSLDENMFFTKFKADILFAQQYALANQTYVNVFIPQGSHRYMLADGYTMILDHEFSERYSIIERTMPRTFQFHPNGNINMFGYFYVQTDNSKYKVMFQIGRGRFYVTEE